MSRLAALALEEYATTKVVFKCMYPSVLVRVVPEPTTVGTLWMPENHKENIYPQAKAVVLGVYEPKMVEYASGKRVLVESGIAVGDVVLFPKWSGEKVPGLDEDNYRLVPARGILGNAGNQESGEILGKLEVTTESIVDKFRRILQVMMQEDPTAKDADAADVPLFIRKIKEEFDIIPKIKTSDVY